MIKVDEHTLKLERDEEWKPTSIERGKIVVICVEIDLCNSTVAKFSLNDHVYKVEYEGLTQICFHCERFGTEYKVNP